MSKKFLASSTTYIVLGIVFLVLSMVSGIVLAMLKAELPDNVVLAFLFLLLGLGLTGFLVMLVAGQKAKVGRTVESLVRWIATQEEYAKVTLRMITYFPL